MDDQEEELGVFDAEDHGEEMDFPEDWMILDDADEEHTGPEQKPDTAGGDADLIVEASKVETKGNEECPGVAASLLETKGDDVAKQPDASSKMETKGDKACPEVAQQSVAASKSEMKGDKACPAATKQPAQTGKPNVKKRGATVASKQQVATAASKQPSATGKGPSSDTEEKPASLATPVDKPALLPNQSTSGCVGQMGTSQTPPESTKQSDKSLNTSADKGSGAKTPNKPQVSDKGSLVKTPAKPSQASGKGSVAKTPTKPQVSDKGSVAETPAKPSQASNKGSVAKTPAKPQDSNKGSVAKTPAKPSQASDKGSVAKTPAKPQDSDKGSVAKTPGKPQASDKESVAKTPAKPQASKPPLGKKPAQSKSVSNTSQTKSSPLKGGTKTSGPSSQVKGQPPSKPSVQSKSTDGKGEIKASNPSTPSLSKTSNASKAPSSGQDKAHLSTQGQAKPSGLHSSSQAKPSPNQPKETTSSACTQGKAASGSSTPKPSSSQTKSVTPAQTSQAPKSSASPACKPPAKSTPGNQTNPTQTSTPTGKVTGQKTEAEAAVTSLVQPKEEQSVEKKADNQSATSAADVVGDKKDIEEQQPADSMKDTTAVHPLQDLKLSQDVVVKVRRLDEVKSDEKSDEKKNESDTEMKDDSSGKGSSIMKVWNAKTDVTDKSTSEADKTQTKPVPQKVDSNKSQNKPGEKPTGTSSGKPLQKPGDKVCAKSSEKPQKKAGDKPNASSSETTPNKAGGKPSASSSEMTQSKGVKPGTSSSEKTPGRGVKLGASSSEKSLDKAGVKPSASSNEKSLNKAGVRPSASSQDRSQNTPGGRHDEKLNIRLRHDSSREIVHVRPGDRRRSRSRSNSKGRSRDRSRGRSRDRSRGRSRDKSSRHDRGDRRISGSRDRRPADSSTSSRPAKATESGTLKTGVKKSSEAKISSSTSTKSTVAKKNDNVPIKKDQTNTKSATAVKTEDEKASGNDIHIVEETCVIAELGLKEKLEQGLWRFSLRLSPLELADFAKQEFRNLMNTAQDIVLFFKNQGQNKKKKGEGHMYFNRLLTTKCTMQKLFQLQLSTKKIEIEINRKLMDSKEKDTALLELDLTFPGTLGTATATNMLMTKGAAEDKNVHISNVPKNTTQELLFVVFPTAFSIQMPRDGKDKGNVLIQFRSAQCATDIMRCYTSVTINKTKLKMTRANQSLSGSRMSLSTEKLAGWPADNDKKSSEASKKKKDVKETPSHPKASGSQGPDMVYQIPVLSKRTITAKNAGNTQLKKGRVGIIPEADNKRPRMDQPPPPLPPPGFSSFPPPTSIPPPMMPSLQGAYSVPPPALPSTTPPLHVVPVSWPVTSGMSTAGSQMQMAGPQNSMTWHMSQPQSYEANRKLQGTEAISPEWDEDGSRFRRDSGDQRRRNEVEIFKRTEPVGLFSRRRSLSPVKPLTRGSQGSGRPFRLHRSRSPVKNRPRSNSPGRTSSGLRLRSPLRRGARRFSRTPPRASRQSYSPISPERRSRSPRRPDHSARRSGVQGRQSISPARRRHSPNRKGRSPVRQRRQSPAGRQDHRSYSPISQGRLSRSPGRRADRPRRGSSLKRRSHSPQRKGAGPQRGRSSEKKPLSSAQKTQSPARDARKGPEDKTSGGRQHQGRSGQSSEARTHSAGKNDGSQTIDEQAALLHREITKALASRHSDAPHRAKENEEPQKVDRAEKASDNRAGLTCSMRNEKATEDRGGWIAPTRTEKATDRGGWIAPTRTDKTSDNRGGWTTASKTEKTSDNRGGWIAATRTEKASDDRGGWTASAAQSSEQTTAKKGLFPAAFSSPPATATKEAFPSAKSMNMMSIPGLDLLLAATAEKKQLGSSRMSSEKNWQARDDPENSDEATLRQNALKAFGKHDRQRETNPSISDMLESFQERDFPRQGNSEDWKRESPARLSPMFDRPRSRESGAYSSARDEGSNTGPHDLMNRRLEAAKHLARIEFKTPSSRSQGLEPNRPDPADRRLARLGASDYQHAARDEQAGRAESLGLSASAEKGVAGSSSVSLMSALRNTAQAWSSRPAEQPTAPGNWLRNPSGPGPDCSAPDHMEMDRSGYDRRDPGMERQGFDRSGSGLDRSGPSRPGTGFDGSGMDRSGFDRTGMDRPGPGFDHAGSVLDRSGFDRPGKENQGMERTGINQPGLDRLGMEHPGPNLPELDRPGMNRWADPPGVEHPRDLLGMDYPRMNRHGFERPGIDHPGIGQHGFDNPGPDRAGPNPFGLDRPGRDGYGMDRSMVNLPTSAGFEPLRPDGAQQQRPLWQDQSGRPEEPRGGFRAQDWDLGQQGPDGGYGRDPPMPRAPPNYGRGEVGNERGMGRGMPPNWEAEGGPVPGNREDGMGWPVNQGNGTQAYGGPGSWLPPPHRPYDGPLPPGHSPYGPPRPPF